MNVIEEVIEAILEEKEEEAKNHDLIIREGNRAIYVFYPSEALYCPRFLYFKRIYPDIYKKAITEEKKRYMLRGTILHDYLLSKLSYPTEVEISEDYQATDNAILRISGRADVVTENKIIELKTARILPKEPLDHHIAQLNIYLHLFGKRHGEIIYINPDNLETRKFEIYHDSALVNQVISEFLEVIRAIEDDEPPKTRENWFCKYCEFHDKCKNNSIEKYFI